jgi:hypothetical protein
MNKTSIYIIAVALLFITKKNVNRINNEHTICYNKVFYIITSNRGFGTLAARKEHVQF